MIPKLFQEIFPQNKKEWDKYFTYCIHHSYIFYPIGLTLVVMKDVLYFLFEKLLLLCLILLFPLTRIELRVRYDREKMRRIKKGIEE